MISTRPASFETRRRRRTSGDRKSTRLNSSHLVISYAVFCLKKKRISRRRRSIVSPVRLGSCVFFFFFNDTATTEIYTLSLHDALPISRRRRTSCSRGCPASVAGRGLCAGAESRRVPQR